MKKTIRQFGALMVMAIAVGIFSVTAFGQKSEIEYKIEYYAKSVEQWTKYRDETVLPYYNDPTYYRWARNEYTKANYQIATAQKYQAYYQQQQSKYVTAGTEVIIRECWVRVANGACSMIYGRVLYYDNGASDGSDYYSKREQMTNAGYSFAYANEYSRKRIGDPKYR
jgi:hypothetical protein